MRLSFLFAMLTLSAASVALADPPPGTVPERCGLVAETIPDFRLPDVNPTSLTYGQEVGRDDFLGKVLVVYFSSAT